MRYPYFFILIFILMGCKPTWNVTTVIYPLDGIWVPIHQEIGGKVLPALVFEKDVLIIGDSIHPDSAANIDVGSLAFGRDQMKIYRKKGANEGKYYQALISHPNSLPIDTLMIWYDLSGGGYKYNVDIHSEPNLFLSTYIRKGPSAKNDSKGSEK